LNEPLASKLQSLWCCSSSVRDSMCKMPRRIGSFCRLHPGQEVSAPQNCEKFPYEQTDHS
jgi:hypothetical protein